MGNSVSKCWIAVLVTLSMVFSFVVSPGFAVKVVYAEDGTETIADDGFSSGSSESAESEESSAESSDEDAETETDEGSINEDGDEYQTETDVKDSEEEEPEVSEEETESESENPVEEESVEEEADETKPASEDRIAEGVADVKTEGDLDPFTDLTDSSKYYYEALVWAKKNGVAFGYRDGAFGVNDALTRADMLCFLYRMEGSPDVNGIVSPFWDVTADDYFSDAVIWAYANGVTAGESSTEFGPYDTCTRVQYLSFLYRRAGSPEVSGNLTFTDTTDSDAYYYHALLWAYENRYLYGYTGGAFGVGDAVLRVDAVTILYRMTE